MTAGRKPCVPLAHRKSPRAQIKKRVGENCRNARNERSTEPDRFKFCGDAKQKISLGRGLVRPDVSAVLFDRTLTVIDPHLQMAVCAESSKQIHHELKLTLI